MVMALDAANFFIWGILGLLGWHSSNAAVADTVAASRKDFSKYKLAKAFIRWSREHDLNDLKAAEITQAEKLIEKVNKALQ